MLPIFGAKTNTDSNFEFYVLQVFFKVKVLKHTIFKSCLFTKKFTECVATRFGIELLKLHLCVNFGCSQKVLYCMYLSPLLARPFDVILLTNNYVFFSSHTSNSFL